MLSKKHKTRKRNNVSKKIHANEEKTADIALKISKTFRLWAENIFTQSFWNFKHISNKTREIIDNIYISHSYIFNNIMSEHELYIERSYGVPNPISAIYNLKCDGRTVIYATCYATNSDGMFESLKIYNSNVRILLYTLGGGFSSMDGEYRSGVVRPLTISDLFVKKIIVGTSKTWELTNKLTMLEIYANEFLNRHRIKLGHIIIEIENRGSTEQFNEATEPDSNEWSYAKRLFMLALFKFIYENINGIYEHHINENYTFVMSQDMDRHKILYNKFVKKMGIKYVNKLYKILSNAGANLNSYARGIKSIPLSIGDSSNPFNIYYQPWREYLILSKLSLLAVNNICGGFPMVGNFELWSNVGKGMFESESQYARMLKGEKAREIVTMLLSAKKLALFQAEHDDINADEEVKTMILKRFKSLTGDIEKPMDYIRETLIMSGQILNIYMEDVGATIYSILLSIKTDSELHTKIGNIFKKKGYKYFEGYMFEFCYDIYCMYRHGIVAHGDAHLNNITLSDRLRSTRKSINIQFDDIANPHVVYIMGKKEEYQFHVPASRYSLCVIDYSRSIIDINRVDEFKSGLILKKFNFMTNRKKFINSQIEKLGSLYVSILNCQAQKESVVCTIKNNYNACVKLIGGVIDIYKFMGSMLKFLSTEDAMYDIYPGVNTFLKKIISDSEYYLVNEFNKLVSNGQYGREIESKEYLNPIMDIILKNFSHFIIDEKTEGNTIDCYYADREILYTMDRLDSIPDYHKYVKYYESDVGTVETPVRKFKKIDETPVESPFKFDNMQETFKKQMMSEKKKQMAIFNGIKKYDEQFSV